MKLMRTVLWSALSRQSRSPRMIRAFSASPLAEADYGQNSSPIESDHERRIFSNGTSNLSPFFSKLDKAEKAGMGSAFNASAFYGKLDKAEKAGMGSAFSTGNRSSGIDGLNDSYDTLTDGMDYKLKKAATYFEYDPDEVSKDDYSFRADVNFASGMTYDTKDLDLEKPGVRRPVKRSEFETTTDEILRKADFRNVRFLANFITEAGVIIKRSKTGISAKAQRKVAREIKTARAFGLMPFTTMGTKHFVYGRTMENQDVDFEYEAFDHNFVDDE